MNSVMKFKMSMKSQVKLLAKNAIRLNLIEIVEEMM